MAFVVRVVDDEDEALEGVRVVLSFTETTRGQTDPLRTDSEGCAEFDGYEDGEVKVFLDGEDCATCDYVDGDEITVTR
jgi:hypothetical protein